MEVPLDLSLRYNDLPGYPISLLNLASCLFIQIQHTQNEMEDMSEYIVT
jgi:hypothetical protein